MNSSKVMIPEYGGKEGAEQGRYRPQDLPRQEVKTDPDSSPEGSYEQEGKQQSLGEFQAGGIACGPRRIVGAINRIEFRKPVETPHKLVTIQQEK